MIYKVTGKSVEIAGVVADLDRMGQNDESITAPGRVASHELDDGSYKVKGQGRSPSTINFSGEFDSSDLDAQAALFDLVRMRGRKVTLSLDGANVGDGILQSVNPSRQNRVGNFYPTTSWRIDIMMEDLDA